MHISVRDHDSAASVIWGHRYISAVGKPADTEPETKEDQPHPEVKRHQNVKVKSVKLRFDTYRTGPDSESQRYPAFTGCCAHAVSRDADAAVTSVADKVTLSTPGLLPVLATGGNAEFRLEIREPGSAVLLSHIHAPQFPPGSEETTQ